MAISWDACSRGAYMSADTLGAHIYIWPSAGTLAAGRHICWLTCLEHAYIIWPSAGMLAAGVHICWLTRLEHAYIIWPSAGTLAAGRHICRPTRTERQ